MIDKSVCNINIIFMYSLLMFVVESVHGTRNRNLWNFPCSGSTLSEHRLQHPEKESLEAIFRRVNEKLHYFIKQMETLKDEMREMRFQDSDFYDFLESHSRLAGLPMINLQPTKELPRLLSEDYQNISKLAAFMEFLPLQEPNTALRRRGRKVFVLTLDLLCELNSALHNIYSNVPDMRSFVIPVVYRSLSDSYRSAWNYILIRDVLLCFRAFHYQLYQLISKLDTNNWE